MLDQTKIMEIHACIYEQEPDIIMLYSILFIVRSFNRPFYPVPLSASLYLSTLFLPWCLKVEICWSQEV